MKLKLLIFLANILFSISIVLGQTIQNIGVPYVENFPKNIYNAGNQNWAIVKDKNGIIYFGNSEGLLSYDGSFLANSRFTKPFGG